ncbi:MAG: hypothetical protein BGP12_07745 [Rhodospirillales bacterium 70-18]|nr:MAG: hypothetical protein BGP12_07745 [Rhodospirillales bacterium 70-18]
MRLLFRSLFAASMWCRLLSVVMLLASGVPARAQSGAAPLVVIRDAETETLLRTFANPLFRAAGLSPGMVRIIVIRDDALNSFVSTGNRMFINSGLIARCRDAGELIGVIAHETGHIRGGHLLRLPEMMRAAMLKSIAAMLIGAAAGVAGGSPDAAIGTALGGQQMAMRGFLSFTRSMEQAADQSALEELDANHWSSRGMLELLRVMQEQDALTSDLQDPYLLTHPLTRDRIALVAAHVAASPYSSTPFPPGFESGFAMVRAKLRAFLDPSSLTLRRVSADDRSAPARYARAIALYRLGHTDQAVALIDGLLAEQPGNPWLHELKGQILFEGGRGRAAIAPYQEAERLAPGQPLIRAGLARAMIETNDRLLLQPAITQLQAALARERDDAENWRLLGIAWGRLGNLGQADLALAEEAMARDDIPAAKRLATRALKALPAGPARQRALDIANAVKKENREGY